MDGPTHRVCAARLGLWALLPALMAVGCAQPNQQPALPPQPAVADDFAAGKDRPPTAKTLYGLARLLASQGREAEREYVLAEIVKKHPDFLPAYCDLAELQLRQRRTQEAAATLHLALALAPNDPVLLNNLGMCRVLQSDYAAALDFFRRASAAHPANTRYRSNMAMSLGMLGRMDEAKALYEQILPRDEVAWNLKTLDRARRHATQPAASRPLAEK